MFLRKNKKLLDFDTVNRVANAVASRYKRKCWWADIEDLRHEAIVAILRAAKTADPQSTIPFDGYAARAAALSIRAYLWSVTAPVNESWHRVKDLAGVHRTKLTNDIPLDFSIFTELEKRQWREQVYSRLMELSSQIENGEFALAMLLEGKPAKVCYKANAKLRRYILNDSKLYYLWKDSP